MGHPRVMRRRISTMTPECPSFSLVTWPASENRASVPPQNVSRWKMCKVGHRCEHEGGEKNDNQREETKKKKYFLELARCVFVCQRALALVWLGERAMSSRSRASAPPQASPPSPLLRRRRAEHPAPDSWARRAASEPSSWVEWCPSCSAEDTGPTRPVSALFRRLSSGGREAVRPVLIVIA